MFLLSGMIPRVTPYENGLKGAMRYDRDEAEWFSDEQIADERLLMCNLKGTCLTYILDASDSKTTGTDKGIVVFTGCSHSGIVNTVKHAVDLLDGSVPLHAVIGGFHLATCDKEHVNHAVKDLKRLDPAVLLPGHCSGWRAKFAIEASMPGTLVPCTVGVRITF